ncbi:hypothetical protein EVAR_55922_1 [Eumeta japonica]|uniref:Uncharacterized protein n=1 Tax=Eumeta variegata TaxID=151549 RepID=A0A4C1YZ70_EUMVA|nr:hypothetical protein EVAR_55922_1 [Eumeta japonica]
MASESYNAHGPTCFWQLRQLNNSGEKLPREKRSTRLMTASRELPQKHGAFLLKDLKPSERENSSSGFARLAQPERFLRILPIGVSRRRVGSLAECATWKRSGTSLV